MEMLQQTLDMMVSKVSESPHVNFSLYDFCVLRVEDTITWSKDASPFVSVEKLLELNPKMVTGYTQAMVDHYNDIVIQKIEETEALLKPYGFELVLFFAISQYR